jgi:hypothetical protein
LYFCDADLRIGRKARGSILLQREAAGEGENASYMIDEGIRSGLVTCNPQRGNGGDNGPWASVNQGGESLSVIAHREVDHRRA